MGMTTQVCRCPCRNAAPLPTFQQVGVLHCLLQVAPVHTQPHVVVAAIHALKVPSANSLGRSACCCQCLLSCCAGGYARVSGIHFVTLEAMLEGINIQRKGHAATLGPSPC